MPFTIIVGIDFGTTFSGAAWATTKKPDAINVITSWESEYNSCSDRPKCPSLLQYGEVDEKTPWGYNIPPNKDVIQWFKLLLLDKQDVPEDVARSAFLKQAAKRQQRLNKKPVELVACYLRSLWRFCMDGITRAQGTGEIDSCKIRIVITVPAMWPHYAQDRMRQAVELAGMLQERTTSTGSQTPELEFVSEPEAAALAVLADFHPRPNIKEGDTIVVCDAGGGTADLISYKLESLKTFQLRECVVGEGGLCGGIFVDQNFKKLIAEELGGSTWFNLDSEDRRKFMKEQWEACIKPQFSGNDRVFYPDVPDGYVGEGIIGKRKRSQKLALGYTKLRQVFDPVINEVCALLQRQIDAILAKNLPHPKFIILVGGFGCCRYLFNKLVELYPNTTILNPPTDQAWTAVCRGAVRHALTRRNQSKISSRTVGTRGANNANFVVQSRIARVSLGFNFHAPWDPTVHKKEDYSFDELRGEARAMNQIVYVVKKGESLDIASSSTHDFFRVFTADDDTEVEEDLYYTALDEPPCRVTADVKRLCSVKWKHRVDLSELKTNYSNKGKEYHLLEYKIRVKADGAALKIDVFRGRRRVGNGEVRIEF